MKLVPQHLENCKKKLGLVAATESTPGVPLTGAGRKKAMDTSVKQPPSPPCSRLAVFPQHSSWAEFTGSQFEEKRSACKV